MLTGLSIKNVVLIESLNLEFKTGLTALTGETGAGKSIVLDALGMATGARSDKGLIRSGADKAINDAPIGVKLLSEIGRGLLEVHGQHDGRGLMDVATHLDMLDNYGAHKKLRDACSEAFHDLKSAREQVEILYFRQKKAEEDREFFKHAMDEIDRLNPKAGEDEQLAVQRRFFQGAEVALTELAAAEAALGENGAFEDRLATALAHARNTGRAKGCQRSCAKFPDGTRTARPY